MSDRFTTFDSTEEQLDLLCPIPDLEIVRILLADLHDDLRGKLARFRQLADLSGTLGRQGTMLTGGEVTFAVWSEARTSYVHGNYVAAVMLCQGLAEHLLASYLAIGLNAEALPKRVGFKETLDRCQNRGLIDSDTAALLRQLMELRNPLSHYRSIEDVQSLTRRVFETGQSAETHLHTDAIFAVSTIIRVLSLPEFRVDR